MFDLQPPRHISTLPESGPSTAIAQCPPGASSGLVHRSNLHPYSITSLVRAGSVGGTVSPSAFALLRLNISLNLMN